MVAAPPAAQPFRMHGARAALASHAAAAAFDRQLTALESAVASDPGLAFDLAKSLVESVCRTLLRDHNVTYSQKDDVAQIFRQTLSCLKLAPESVKDEAAARSLRITVQGLNTALQGICELRNQQGWVSHGREAYAVSLDPLQAELAARSADTIVSFLYGVHIGYTAAATTPLRTEYKDHPEFNRYIDESNPEVEIFGASYQPSEVLFSVDPEAYRASLAEFTPAEQDAPAATTEAGVPE